MTDLLTADAVKIERFRITREPLMVELVASAESTRYHTLFVRRVEDGHWWVMCENLQIALPLLPRLTGWHWTYIAGYVNNPRSAMAIWRLMCRAFEMLFGPDQQPTDPPVGTCDWGWCDGPAEGWRWEPPFSWRPEGRWLPVCTAHLAPVAS